MFVEMAQREKKKKSDGELRSSKGWRDVQCETFDRERTF